MSCLVFRFLLQQVSCFLVPSDRHSHERRFPFVPAAAGVRPELLDAVHRGYSWTW